MVGAGDEGGDSDAEHFTAYAWLQILSDKSNKVPGGQSITKALNLSHMINFEQASGWAAKTAKPSSVGLHR